MSESVLEAGTLEESKGMMDLIKPTSIDIPAEVDSWLDSVDVKQAASVVDRFLDVVSTGSGRATHYNSKEEQEKALREVHSAMFNIDRGLYSVLVMLQGATDHSRQLAATTLLDNPSRGASSVFIDPRDEGKILSILVRNLPTQRMLKLFVSFATGDNKINNARTRKLILRAILQADTDTLEYWAVKYRQKISVALRHAIGQKRTGIITSIIKKSTNVSKLDDKEVGILNTTVGKYILEHGDGRLSDKLQIIGFVFGVESDLTLPKLKAYVEVKGGKWNAGKELPIDTMEGLRKQYFPTKKKEDVLALTKDNLSKGQKMSVQKRAKAAGVKVEFDPKGYDPVKLYKYAYEMGLTEEIVEALNDKARKAGESFPVRFEKVGVLVDNSQSMYGHKTQAYHPISVALSIRDMLYAVSNECVTKYTSVHSGMTKSERRLPQPSGDTSLALHFVELMETEPDAVFILSDGYENTSAGRLSEVLKVVRDMGIETPVFQISPVSAAESSGIKNLAPGLVNVLPVANSTALGTTMIKAMLTSDPKNGLRYLIGTSLKQLEMKGV